jgi:hypothetical protein
MQAYKMSSTIKLVSIRRNINRLQPGLPYASVLCPKLRLMHFSEPSLVDVPVAASAPARPL